MSSTNRVAAAMAIVLASCARPAPVPVPVAVPAPSEPASQVGTLIDRLGAESIDDRDQAGRALFQMGVQAIDALHAAATTHPDAEIRGRASDLKTRILLEGPQGLLAFIAEEDGHLYFAIPHDWRLTKQLAPDDDMLLRCHWFPDGSRLAVQVLWRDEDDFRDRPRGTWIARTEPPQDLVHLVKTREVRFHGEDDRALSPDGTAFAYAGSDDCLRILGEPEVRIGKFYKTHDAAWSPDGAWIVFTASVSNEDGRTVRTSTYLVKPDGSEMHRAGDEISNFTWGSDSRRVLCTDADWPPEKERTLLIVDFFTGDRRTIAKGPAHEEIPRLSPDERSVAFVRTLDEGQVIFVVELDHLRETRICEARSPIWSPNGTMIAFLADDEDTLAVVTLEGRSVRRFGKVRSFDWKAPRRK